MDSRDFPRGLSPREKAILYWMLEHAAVGDGSSYRGRSLSAVTVVGGCECGCASVDFQEDTGGASILAEAFAEYPDGLKAGLILWGREGELVSLEEYEMNSAADRVPEFADLRPYS